MEPLTIQQKFGLRVRALREKTGESQDKFALRVGIERAHYARIERGEKNCTLRLIAMIADGLGVPPRELFKFKGG